MVNNVHKKGRKKAMLSIIDISVAQSNAQVLSAGANCEHQNLPKKTKACSGRQKECTCMRPQASTSAECKYVLPELFSTLAVGKQIERVRNTQAAPITNEAQLTPDSKKKLNTKITKKLNHQPDTNVYSGLAPVGVKNDELRLQAETRTKYKFTGKKDPEPVLSDYLIPLDPYLGSMESYIPVNKIDKELQDNFSNIMYVMSILDGECPSNAS